MIFKDISAFEMLRSPSANLKQAIYRGEIARSVEFRPRTCPSTWRDSQCDNKSNQSRFDAKFIFRRRVMQITPLMVNLNIGKKKMMFQYKCGSDFNSEVPACQAWKSGFHYILPLSWKSLGRSIYSIIRQAKQYLGSNSGRSTVKIQY